MSSTAGTPSANQSMRYENAKGLITAQAPPSFFEMVIKSLPTKTPVTSGMPSSFFASGDRR